MMIAWRDCNFQPFGMTRLRTVFNGNLRHDRLAHQELLSELKNIAGSDRAKKARLLVRLARHLFLSVIEPAEQQLKKIVDGTKKKSKTILDRTKKEEAEVTQRTQIELASIRETRECRLRELEEVHDRLSRFANIDLPPVNDQLNARKDADSKSLETGKIDIQEEITRVAEKAGQLARKLHDATTSDTGTRKIGPGYDNSSIFIVSLVFISIALAVTYNIVKENIDALTGVFIYIPVVLSYAAVLFFTFKWGLDKRLQAVTNALSIYYDLVETDAKLSNLCGLREEQVQETIRAAMAKASANGNRELEEVRAGGNRELERVQDLVAKDTQDVSQRISRFNEEAGVGEVAWKDTVWNDWQPAASPCNALRLGKFALGPKSDGEIIRFLRAKESLNFTLPALVHFAPGRSILVTASGAAKRRAVEAVQGMMLRLLATMPPGKMKFTFIDPVGLGQNVAGLLGLGEVDEDLITNRAWTEPQHIEQKLQDLTEHMENVIQKYLKIKYKTIDDYNRAGQVAEAYRALVVMDFPTNFSETAARRLVSIAQNGPRCGVYTFVMADGGKPAPYGFDIADLERVSIAIPWVDDRFIWDDKDFRHCQLELDASPPNRLVERVIESVGKEAKEAMKVEVPYDRILELARLGEDAWWKGTTENGIEVPLGPTGAAKAQCLSLGAGTAHHALIVGRTGSGKSNLQHVIITSLALAYSPEEIQLYLVDFKQGVEFKPYAESNLPHARVIAIESEREFGLSVLRGLNTELHDRGEIFRHCGASDIAQYRKKTCKAMPRLLLLVDEFQEFFSRDDSISGEASQILERLTRQGRGYGIHVMLATQSLAGTPLSHAVFGQMQVRIALQCSERDSTMILADDNLAARRLSRPGEAIYNAASGLFEGNTPFQVALFKDEDRSRYLAAVSRLAAARDKPFDPPIVFEGHEPARLELCQPLKELLAARDWPTKDTGVDAWLGEPVAIRPPTAVQLRRQSGCNLLVVCRDEAEGIGMTTACLLSLAAKHRPESARFYILDLTVSDAPWAGVPNDMRDLLPHHFEVFGRRDIPGKFADLTRQVNERIEAERVEGPALYLVILGLHRARDLRQDEGGFSSRYGAETDKEANLLQQFETLLREGPEVDLHVVVWCDTFGNLQRFLDRRLLGEFGTRVAGAMSNDDSHGLLDDAAAARLDRPHRAIKFDEEHVGVLEQFRPYAIPERAWIESIAQILNGRRVARANPG